MAKKLLKQLEQAIGKEDDRVPNPAPEDLNAEFARHIQRLLREDPEVANELRELGELESWVKEKVDEQTNSDDIAPCVRRFVRQHLKAATVVRLVLAAERAEAEHRKG